MPKQKEGANFIEETGLLFENMGVTRMAGRILGYLMVADNEMVSFDEITKDLQASKSSISTNLKSLNYMGFIKPKTVPGERKTYYVLSPDMDWKVYFENRMEMLRIFYNMFQEALDIRKNKDDNSARWLRQTREFYAFILSEFPAILERWEQKQKKG